MNVSSGVLAVTGGGDGSIYIGRGYQSNPGTGAATALRVVGDASTIVANGSLLMNPDEVAQSSTLVAQITGPTHTPIRVSGDADIRNGELKVELNGYTPTGQDSWVLIEAGVELDADLARIDQLVDAAGYDPMIHGQASYLGQVLGPFQDTDFAALPLGLSWEVTYPTPELVVLSVTGTVALTGDYNNNGRLDAGDLDLQGVAINGKQNPPAYDLNKDNLVDYEDRVFWVEQPTMKNTYIGDANLDGEFNSSDFVDVFVAGKYETGQSAGWKDGDWDANLLFDSADFVAAFVGGGYEFGPRPTPAASRRAGTWQRPVVVGGLPVPCAVAAADATRLNREPPIAPEEPRASGPPESGTIAYAGLCSPRRPGKRCRNIQCFKLNPLAERVQLYQQGE